MFKYSLLYRALAGCHLPNRANIFIKTPDYENRKTKAAEGLLYDANNDPDLQREMLETHSRLHRYNLLPPEELQQRDELIRSILHMGKKGCIISPFYCDYGSNIHIGDNFFANTNLVILDGAKVTIGDNVFIALM